jgi:hypothetical protein
MLDGSVAPVQSTAKYLSTPLVPHGSNYWPAAAAVSSFLTATVTDYAPREVRGCNGGWSLRLLVMGLMDDTRG